MNYAISSEYTKLWKHSSKKEGFSYSVHTANVHLHLEWLHVKHPLSIFTADGLHYTVQMAGVETIPELHTLTVINSC